MPDKKLVWDTEAERLYETGVDHGVLYRRGETEAYDKATVWNGLTGVTESPSGAEPTALYADNIKYLNLRSAEEYSSTITAYSSPEEFDACDGMASPVKGMTIGQQPREMFGFSYRTLVGNAIKGDSYGYKLHLVYGCSASPSEKAYSTVNDSPEAIEFSWEVSTTPVNVTNYKPTATVTIDSTTTPSERLKVLEAVLYGKGEGDDVTMEDKDGGPVAEGPRLPMPDEVAKILAVNPNVALSVEVPTEGSQYNVDVTSLQDNIKITDNAITGELKYFEGSWQEGTWSEDEKTGNFLYLKFDSNDSGTIKTKIEGGKNEFVDATSDKFCIYRIKSNDQKIVIKCSKEGFSDTVNTYSLKGLKLTQKSG